MLTKLRLFAITAVATPGFQIAPSAIPPYLRPCRSPLRRRQSTDALPAVQRRFHRPLPPPWAAARICALSPPPSASFWWLGCCWVRATWTQRRALVARVIRRGRRTNALPEPSLRRCRARAAMSPCGMVFALQWMPAYRVTCPRARRCIRLCTRRGTSALCRCQGRSDCGQRAFECTIVKWFTTW